MGETTPVFVYNDSVVNFSTPNETIVLLNVTASLLSNLYTDLWYESFTVLYTTLI